MVTCPRPRRLLAAAILLSAPGVICGCAAGSGDSDTDLGTIRTLGKADGEVVRRVSFAVGPATDDADGEPTPGAVVFTFRADGPLDLNVEQDRSRSWERMQLDLRWDGDSRRSWRGRSPYVGLAARFSTSRTYEVSILNWGHNRAHGELLIRTRAAGTAGEISAVFNEPDCISCPSPEGDLRAAIVAAIDNASASIDFAAYGFDDPSIKDALCRASSRGVTVRAVTDDVSENANDARGYYEHFFAPSESLSACGAQVVTVRSSAIMHNKYLLVDVAGSTPVVVTGSANFTVAGLEFNHNHMLILESMPELAASYRAEFDQLFDRCLGNQTSAGTCDECTPACTANVSSSGPWTLSGGQVEAFFAPSDNALDVLRGSMITERRDDPDPACVGPDTTCVCRTSGDGYSCDYCGATGDGFGLLDSARERIHASMYSATDQCFALGLKKAHERGVDVVTVWDFVKSGSPYSRDDYVCAEGVTTYISNWGGGSAMVRNHNKVVVVDDSVFDGSMNFSTNGAMSNNENSLLIRHSPLAQAMSEYVLSEAALLEQLGVAPRAPTECACSDLVDNDDNGEADDPAECR